MDDTEDFEELEQLEARCVRTLDTKDADRFRQVVAEDVAADTSASGLPADLVVRGAG